MQAQYSRKAKRRLYDIACSIAIKLYLGAAVLAMAGVLVYISVMIYREF